MLIKRRLNLPQLLAKKSIFLFGPRAVGKSTLIENQLLQQAEVIDLLDEKIFLELASYPSRLEEEYQKGNIVIRPDGKLERRKYLKDYKGASYGNVWDDVLPATGSERIGYPTQKPLALLERIIKASSYEGDTVLDPFCGCATVCCGRAT